MNHKRTVSGVLLTGSILALASIFPFAIAHHMMSA